MLPAITLDPYHFVREPTRSSNADVRRPRQWRPSKKSAEVQTATTTAAEPLSGLRDGDAQDSSDATALHFDLA